MTATVARSGAAGVTTTWRSSPVAVKALLVGVFVSRLGGFLQLFVVLYLIHLGYSSTQAAVGLSGYAAGNVVGLLTGGWLADRLGARRTILCSMLGAAALLFGVLHLRSYAAIVVFVSLVGAVGQAYRPAAANVLSAVTPLGQQTMIFSMQQLALNVGATAAPLLGVALAAVSFRLLFYGEASAVLVYAVIAATLVPKDVDLLATREEAEDAEEASPAGASPRKASYLAVLADRRYLVFLAAVFVIGVVYVQYLATLPLFLRRHGFSTSVFGALLALNSAVVIVGQLPVTRVVQHWQARSAVVGGALLTSIGLAMYAPVWGLAGLVVATLVWSVAECVGTPTLFYGYPVLAAPERLRGCYVGASQAIFALGYALGPPIGVAVWNRTGDAVWWWTGAAGLLAVAAARRGIPLQRRPRTHPAAARAMAAAGGAEA